MVHGTYFCNLGHELETYDQREEAWFCKECNEWLSDDSYRVWHDDGYGETPPWYVECLYCRDEYDGKIEECWMCIRNEEKQSHRCPECEKRIKTFKALIQHLNDKHPTGPHNYVDGDWSGW